MKNLMLSDGQLTAKNFQPVQSVESEKLMLSDGQLTWKDFQPVQSVESEKLNAFGRTADGERFPARYRAVKVIVFTVLYRQ